MAMRPYETRYWCDRRLSKPITRGFPKAEIGSIDGAMKAAGKGLVSKVQCIDRVSELVIWTVLRGRKVPGRNLYSVEAHSGDAP
jgi:hypothetical protein